MPATLTQPVRQRRQMRQNVQRTSALMPRPQETQLQFVDRCRRSMQGRTDEVVAYAYQQWVGSGREQELEQIAQRQFPKDRFKRIRNRPVFVEHTKTRVVTDPETGMQREEVEVYDKAALAGMVRRCNERILDTGDFSPLIDGHTPDPEAVDNGVKMPDVLGYSGPYRMGIVGNTKPKYAIFCDEWHHRECLDRLDKMQRRSPEVWMEDRVEERFFDPIAALGASTPRLDMGLTQFARTADGRLVEKYSAAPVAMPSASSTFLPSDNGERHRAGKFNSDGESNMLSPEDVKQIVSALQQTDVWQWAQSQMEAGDSNATLEQNNAGEPGTDDMAGNSPPNPGDAPPQPEEDSEEYMSGSPAAMWAQVEENEDGMKKRGKGYHKGRMKGNWHQSYECDDEDNDMVSQYMSGDVEEDEMTEYMRSKRSNYMAEGSAEEGDPGDATESSTVADNSLAYSRTRNGAHPQEDMAVKYHRLQKEHSELQHRVQKIESGNRDKYRRARLQQLQAEGYVFDMTDEWSITSGMNDKQFDTHCDKTIVKYERAPMGGHFPQLPTPDHPAPRREGERQRYSKEQAEKIQKHILSARERGKEVSWEEAAAEVAA